MAGAFGLGPIDHPYKAFQPLLDYTRRFTLGEEETNRAVGEYMYMGHDEVKYYYKHINTREYIYIDHEGNMFQ